MTTGPLASVLWVQDDKGHRPFTPLRMRTRNNADLEDMRMARQFCVQLCQKVNRPKILFPLPCSIARLEAFYISFSGIVREGQNIK